MAAAILVMKLQGPNGPITGESRYKGGGTDGNFEGWILLESWSWDLEAGDDQVKPKQLRITKSCDRASPAMMKLLDTTAECPRAEIVLWEASTDSQLEMRIELEKVTLNGFTSSIKQSDKGADVEETWDLGYSDLQLRYYSPEADAPDVRTGGFLHCEFRGVSALGQTSSQDQVQKKRDFERLFAKLSQVEQDDALERLRKIAAGQLDPAKDDADPTLPRRTAATLRGRDAGGTD